MDALHALPGVPVPCPVYVWGTAGANEDLADPGRPIRPLTHITTLFPRGPQVPILNGCSSVDDIIRKMADDDHPLLLLGDKPENQTGRISEFSDRGIAQ